MSERPKYFRAFGDPHGPVHVASSRWPSIVRCGRPKRRFMPTQPDSHDCFCSDCMGLARRGRRRSA